MPRWLRIKTNAEKVIRRFNRLPKTVQANIVVALKRSLLVIESRVRQNTGVKSRRGSAGVFGRLTSYVKASGDLGLSAAIGFRRTRGFPYELAQEFGARAKPGRAMAIPMTPEARTHTSPREMPNLVMVKGPNRAVLITKGIHGRMTVHYVLVKKIKARLRFRENVKAEIPDLQKGIEAAAIRGLAVT